MLSAQRSVYLELDFALSATSIVACGCAVSIRESFVASALLSRSEASLMVDPSP